MARAPDIASLLVQGQLRRLVAHLAGMHSFTYALVKLIACESSHNSTRKATAVPALVHCFE